MNLNFRQMWPSLKRKIQKFIPSTFVKQANILSIWLKIEKDQVKLFNIKISNWLISNWLDQYLIKRYTES